MPDAPSPSDFRFSEGMREIDGEAGGKRGVQAYSRWKHSA
jgi:hypothetical protein